LSIVKFDVVISR